MKRTYLALFILCLYLPLCFSQTTHKKVNPEDVTIVRDKWGVPHIYGKTDADAAYGLAWAHAEDDFETMQEPFLALRGKLGTIKGAEGALWDLFSFFTRIEGNVERQYDTGFSEEFKALISANVQAINEFAKAHPKEVLHKSIFPITNKDVVNAYMMANSVFSAGLVSFGKVMQDQINTFPDMPTGSNGFAFNRSKVEEDCTVLIANPHLPLEGFMGWYEAHVNSEEGWNFSGVTMSSGVTPFIGTNNYLGWTHTVNHADFSDVYELKMHPKDKLKYLYDGEWLELEKHKIKINVKVGPIKVPISKTFYKSKYGAVAKNKTGFYAIKFASNQKVGSSEQWYRMTKAKNFDEFQEVLKMQRITSFNIVYADKDDTIYYLNNGLIPYRKKGLNWQGVLKGEGSDVNWEPNFYPIEKLAQLKNPSCGYLSNHNNTPFSASCEKDNIKASDYDIEMGYLQPGKETNRSLKFQELIGHHPNQLSIADIKKIKYSNEYAKETFFTYNITNLDDLVNLDPKKYPDIRDVILYMKDWDGASNIENEHAAIASLAIVYFMKNYVMKRIGIYDSNSIPEEIYANSIRFAKKHLKKHFGTFKIPLGKLQVHQRGDVELPIPGLAENMAPMMFEKYKKGKLRADGGETFIMLAQYKEDGVQFETIVPFGASNREESPHYTDQMEMYATQKLKPMTLDKETVFKNAVRVYTPGKKP